MNGELLSPRGPAIGFIETSSIARGIEATDAMMKRAAVDLLLTTIVPRGKYLVLVGGAVADVESALRAGLESAEGVVVDHFLIQNVHPQLPAAIKGRVKAELSEAVGIIETKEVASAIYAGDAAVKAANVRLIEARNQPGAKGMVVLTGEVGAVRAAVAAGVATVKQGMLVAEVVIPRAHEALARSPRADAGRRALAAPPRDSRLAVLPVVLLAVYAPARA
jgi:microcompartment protein CcmL/EutN